MAEARARAVELALLEWVNDFPLPGKVTSARQLNDGLVLWEILLAIDPTYFGGRKLPSPEIKDPEHWLQQWQNIKQINKDVANYIRDECTQTLSLRESSVPDAKAIAEAREGSNAEIVKLLKIFLMAAVFSPRANQLVTRMQKLSVDTQAYIRDIVEEMTADDTQGSGSESPAGDRQSEQLPKQISKDPELLAEERLGKILAEKEDLAKDKEELQQEVGDLQNRLSRLQDNNEVLQGRLTKAEDQLGVNGSAKKGGRGDADAVIRQLEMKLQEQEDDIANDEVRILQFQTEAEEQHRTIASLRTLADKSQQLQDELDEIKVERDGLAKKANTLDKYKQKLEAIQDLESENRQLHSEVEELHQQFKLADKERQDSFGLQMTIDRYRRTIEKVEQDHSDLQLIKRRLENDNAMLVKRVEGTAEKQARDVETISELQDKLRELESGAIHVPNDGGSLENELGGGEKSKAELKLEISKLKSEIHKIKSGSDAAAESVMMKNLLDDANKKLGSLETKFLDTYQTQLVLESHLSMLTKGTAAEGTEPFAKLRGMHAETQDELSRAKKALAEIEVEQTILKQELKTAKQDLSMIGKDRVAALAELKQANSTEVEEVRQENKQVSSRNQELVVDLDQQRSLLNRVLLKLSDQKDRLHETELSSGDLKATLDVLKAESRGRQEGSTEVIEKRVVQLQDEAEKTKDKLNSQAERVKKQDETINDLEQRLRRAEEAEREATVKAREQHQVDQEGSQQQELLALARENALMATAWHDLSSRLQQSSVVLQRRSEAPRSWLNKQRMLLNSSTVSPL
ncbi:MAG: hypothetical protein M1832_002541 [Thelocarpon impressellum]|nr:MAG: hypothetical protein M1832_002541 [Thelocarpon impressellum]